LIIRRALGRTTRSFEEPRSGQPCDEKSAEYEFRPAARHTLEILEQIAWLLVPEITGQPPELLRRSLRRLRQDVAFFALELFRSGPHGPGVFLHFVREVFLLAANEAAPGLLCLACC